MSARAYYTSARDRIRETGRAEALRLGHALRSLYVTYHDEEWGVPSHDERHLFEMIVLEGAQAGLSWSTILHKREGYRNAFVGFDPEAVARFDGPTIDRLSPIRRSCGTG